MHRLDQPHAVAERGVEGMHGLVTKIFEVVEAAGPVAFAPHGTVVAASAGRVEETVVLAVLRIDDLQDEQSRVGERLDQFSPHGPLLHVVPEGNTPSSQNLSSAWNSVYQDFHLETLGFRV